MSWDPWNIYEVTRTHLAAQASLDRFVGQNPFACRGSAELAAFDAAVGVAPVPAADAAAAAATAAPAASSPSAGEVKDPSKILDTGSTWLERGQVDLSILRYIHTCLHITKYR